MSKQFWSTHGFGLALAEDDLQMDSFIWKAMKDMDPESCEWEDAFDNLDWKSIRESWRVPDTEVSVIDDEYSGRCFHPASDGHGEYYENKEMLVFWAEHQPNAFKAHYTEESVVEEFRKKLGRYLPEDFDYLAHIGYFSCCAFC